MGRNEGRPMMTTRTPKQVLARVNQMVDRVVEGSKGAGPADVDFLQSLLDMAKTLEGERKSIEALALCRKVLVLAAGEPDICARTRRFLADLMPGYHLVLLNDARRGPAWDRALRAAIRPGMHVLEIGTGAGILAMMAARAGAASVTTCEFHPLVAQVARDIIAHNGLTDRINVICKSSLDLKVGVDLERPADVVFCDNFSDDMFSFAPLNSMADARARLLAPGAVSVPAAASVRLALAGWKGYASLFSAGQSCGFDISPAEVFAPESVDTEIGDPGMRLLSQDLDAFRFDFSDLTYPEKEETEILLEAADDCVVNGVAQWIRLELDADTVLEARPEPGAAFFSNPRFYPIIPPRQVKKGEVMRVHARHDATSLSVWA